MSFITGTATNVGDLIEQLDAFLQLGHALDPQYAGANVGDGVIDSSAQGIQGTAASVNETITLTATDATHFTVVGSVSGALGTAVVGTAFTCAVCGFTLTAGGAAFALGDVITFVMTLPWTRLRSTTDQQKIWSAPGNDGAANIIVGLNRFASSTGDYDDLQLLGAFGYESGNDFLHQPGGMGDEYVPLLRVGSMRFWFVANGRRVVVVVQVSTTYQSFYMGFINTYPSPSQFPYPLAIGGSMAWGHGPQYTANQPPQDDPRWRWSFGGDQLRAFPISHNNFGTGDASFGQLQLRRPDGFWLGMQVLLNTAPNPGDQTGMIWPYSGSMNNLRANLDGSYFLLPILLTEGAPNVFGELDGITAITGFNNVSENTVVINGVAWLLVQNVFRTTTVDYFALKLA